MVFHLFSCLFQPDSSFDSTLYKVFHPDKFDVSQLNPAPVGEVDERARYYGRGQRTVTGASSFLIIMLDYFFLVFV